MFTNKITDNSLATSNADSRFAPVQDGLEKFSKLAMAVSISALLAACGSDGDSGSSVVAEGDVIPSMAVTVEKPSLNAGESTDITVRFTDQNNDLITTAIDVSFSSACLSEDRAIVDGETSTSDGAARVTYTAAGCNGADALRVSATVGDTNLLTNTTITVDVDTVDGISASEPEPGQLALQGIGGVEESSVTFTVRGENGAPVSGQEVTFTLRPTTGGVSLSDPSLVTKSDGTVRVKVYSGTANTVFRVLAEHVETGNKTESSNITVSTGVPVASKFSLSLEPFNPAAANTDGEEVDVSIIASDQYGNPAADGTVINFWSPESGQIEPNCVLDNGRCSVKWISAGDRGDYRHSIIAFTDGAEDFTDNNANNIYEGTDTFNIATHDLSEPYTDENEDGDYDVGEFFVDYFTGDGHGVSGGRDNGDGVWNGPCLQSVNQAALCEGAERMVISRTAVIVNSSDFSKILQLGDFVSPIDVSTTRTLTDLIISDINGSLPYGNSMPGGTKLDFSTTNGEILSGASYTVRSNETRGHELVLVIEPDATSDTGTLTLKVTPPGGAEEVYTWSVDD